MQCGIAAAIVYPTWFFGKPALLEVWNHGYASGPTSGERPEFNLFVRFFPNPANGLAIDQSRVDFNLFLRFTTVFFSLILGAAGQPGRRCNNQRAVARNLEQPHRHSAHRT